MKIRSPNCDRRKIDALLRSECLTTPDVDLIQHLDHCLDCQKYLEIQTADIETWKLVSEMLQISKFDIADRDEFSAATTGFSVTPPSFHIQEVIDHLAPTEDPDRLGRLDTYEVSGVIGTGGMGVVLKAIDPALDRVVAIKMMAPHLANNGTARKRFSREAKAAAAVIHPNVIPIHSVSADKKIPYLVMTYIRGGSLQKRLDREGPLPLLDILRIAAQISAGLAAAHEQGLIHRDIKPENILLEEGVERVTLTDFGLARTVDDASLTREGAIAGTPRYMSPEQAKGQAVDQQSDLFSLGSVLYSMCTGRPPFRSESSYGVMRAIIEETPPPVQSIAPMIPAWLIGIIDKLMAKDKTERFDSAGTVHQLLEGCIAHLQQPEEIDLPKCLPDTRKKTKARPKPRNMKLIIGSMLAAGLAGIIAFLSWAGPYPSETDRQKILGTWRVLDANFYGVSLEEKELLTYMPFEFEDTKARITYEGQLLETGYAINPDAHPKQIDLFTDDLVLQGIYRLDGDILTICLPTSGSQADRPTEFKSDGENHQNALLTLKREGFRDQEIDNIREKLRGEWTVLSHHTGEVENENWKTYKYQIVPAHNGILFKLWAGQTGVPETFQWIPTFYKIDSTQNPIRMTEMDSEGNSIGHGIIQLKKDQMVICFGETAPDNFQIQSGINRTVLKRKTSDSLDTPDPNGSDDAVKIQGVWHLVDADLVEDARPLPEAFFMQFKGNLSTIAEKAGQIDRPLNFELDSTTAPKSIEFFRDGSPRPRAKKSIYELEGDTLKLEPEAEGFGQFRLKRVKPVSDPSATYVMEPSRIKSVIYDRNNGIEITFQPLPESVWHCPGANLIPNSGGYELQFVRARSTSKSEATFPAETLQTGGWKRVYIQSDGKPVFIQFPSGLELLEEKQLDFRSIIPESKKQ